jgi:hypothetical protein
MALLETEKNFLATASTADIEGFIADLDIYADVPVGINEFIDHHDFLAPHFEGVEFLPYWRKVLNELYPTPLFNPYWLVAFRGSIGRGKTTTACCGIAYDLMRLLCLYNPQKNVGLTMATKILFAIFNVTQSLSSDVWDTLQHIFANSPYFTEKLGGLNIFGQKKTTETWFPKRIDFFTGSRLHQTMGKAVFEAILDEADFEVVTDQVYKNFNSILRRMQSRFMEAGTGQLPGKIWLVSSEGEKFSLINRIVDSYPDKKGIYVDRSSLWEVRPDRFGKKRFKVFKGTHTKRPQIVLKRNDPILKEQAAHIINVPTELLQTFQADINSALRDHAGVAVVSKYNLIGDRERLHKALVIKPIFPSVIKLDFDDPKDVIQKYALIPGYFGNHFQPNLPRHVHIDIALGGEGNDRLGLGISFISEFQERTIQDPETLEEITDIRPNIISEFAFSIEATGGNQIPLYKVRAFIQFLANKGFVIAKVTSDLASGMAADMLQMLKLAGFTTEPMSVDKTSIPYIDLRSAIYEGRWQGPNDPLLRLELENLELSAKGDKVDHPVDKMENGATPSKDTADGVCGAHATLIRDAGNYMMLYLESGPTPGGISDGVAEMFWKGEGA